MNARKRVVSAAALAAVLALVGCVSANKYKKLETDSKAQQDALAAKNTALAQELASMKDANASLSQQAEQLKKSSEDTKTQYDAVLNQLQNEVQAGNLKVTQYQNMLTVDVAEQIFFTSGSAKLKKGGQDVLRKVGAALIGYQDKIIRVVGHTDNIPLGKAGQAIFPSNWELSVIRATNVVRFLQDECKIPPERLVASGRGEYEPVAPNDTPEGRQKNRRIEIMLIDKSVVQAMQGKPKQ